jgi:hypothetical protein
VFNAALQLNVWFVDIIKFCLPKFISSFTSAINVKLSALIFIHTSVQLESSNERVIFIKCVGGIIGGFVVLQLAANRRSEDKSKIRLKENID